MHRPTQTHTNLLLSCATSDAVTRCISCVREDDVRVQTHTNTHEHTQTTTHTTTHLKLTRERRIHTLSIRQPPLCVRMRLMLRLHIPLQCINHVPEQSVLLGERRHLRVESGTADAGHVWGLGFRVWSLRFAVWGLGFGGWASGWVVK